MGILIETGDEQLELLDVVEDGEYAMEDLPGDIEKGLLNESPGDG